LVNISTILFKRYKTTAVTDNELIASYNETDDTIYIGELYKRYSHLVFGVCLKYLKDPDNSKDAVMQIFEKLITDLKKHQVENFKSWLYTVAKNHCLMIIRSQQTMITFQDHIKIKNNVMESDLDLHLPYENIKEKEIELNNLEKAINELNSNQKICIELFYLKEKCYQEVAEITGYSMNEVKSYIQNGKRNLKIILSQRNEKN